MDNSELLNQIASLLEDQTQHMQAYIDKRLEEQNHQIHGYVEKRLDEQTKQLQEYVKGQVRKIEIKIENNVTRRIDALFDGYKLNHEKQEELEKHDQRQQSQIDDLQVRVAVIESKQVGYLTAIPFY